MEVTSISESIDTELLFVSQNMHDVRETTYTSMQLMDIGYLKLCDSQQHNNKLH